MEINAYSYTGVEPVVGDVKVDKEHLLYFSIRESHRQYAEGFLEGLPYFALSQRKIPLGSSRTFKVWLQLLGEAMGEDIHEFSPLTPESEFPIVLNRKESDRLAKVFNKHYNRSFDRNEAYFRSVYRELQTMFTIAANRESAVVIKLEDNPANTVA